MSVVIKGRSSFVLALRSLWLHKLRSILSVLGIIIGTASVIALMAFGRGSMEDALEDIRRQGTTNVIVSSVKPVDTPASATPRWNVSYGLTWEDFERFKLIDTVIGQVPMRIIPQEARHIGRKVSARVVATTEAYAKINHFEMAAGRFLRDGENPADEGDGQRLRNVGGARFGRGQGVIPLRGSPRQGRGHQQVRVHGGGGHQGPLAQRESPAVRSRRRTTTSTFICRSGPAGSASANASCFDRAPAS